MGNVYGEGTWGELEWLNIYEQGEDCVWRGGGEKKLCMGLNVCGQGEMFVGKW